MNVKLPENYTRSQLHAYTLAKLGVAVWRIEGFKDTDAIDYVIDEAVATYSRQCPLMKFEAAQPFARLHTLVTERAYAVLDVHFMMPTNRFSNAHTLVGLTQNLTGVAPMNIAGTTPNISGDIMAFLQWQRSFQRVTSTLPQWFFDDETNQVAIYNPGAYFTSLIIAVRRVLEDDLDTIKKNHKEWLRRYVLALAKQQLGVYRRKFGSSIQGPGGTKLELDGDKLVDEAEKETEKLESELRTFRSRPWPKYD